MFRKPGSNMSHMPMPVGGVNGRAKKVRIERSIRRLGLIFIGLAVAIQLLTMANPSEQALATTTYDVIPGGVSSVRQILDNFDNAARPDLKNLLHYFDITREDVTNLDNRRAKICTSDASTVAFTRKHIFDSSKGEVAFEIPNNQGSTTFYSVPLPTLGSYGAPVCYDALLGHTHDGKWFGILTGSGDLLLKANDIQVPRGHFTNVSCTTIEGIAYDGRQIEKPVTIYLFVGGPPGVGKPYGPITANKQLHSSNHGFSFDLPNGTPSLAPIWGVLQPLGKWSAPMIQFDNTYAAPQKCKQVSRPTVTCDALTVEFLQPKQLTLTSNDHVNEDRISGYHFTVRDSSGKSVYDKSYRTEVTTLTTNAIDIVNKGIYTATVDVSTATRHSSCQVTFNVSANSCTANNIGPNACHRCAYDKRLWADDDGCLPKIAISKTAKNLTRDGANANNTIAGPGDRIEYSLYTVNLGSVVADAAIEENLANVMEYATLLDSGGGRFDNSSKIISWGITHLEPQQVDSRKIIVGVDQSIPGTPIAANDPTAYNCSITNSYGNSVSVLVRCPIDKTFEALIRQLPTVSNQINLIFDTLLLGTATSLYIWSRERYATPISAKKGMDS